MDIDGAAYCLESKRLPHDQCHSFHFVVIVAVAELRAAHRHFDQHFPLRSAETAALTALACSDNDPQRIQAQARGFDFVCEDALLIFEEGNLVAAHIGIDRAQGL